MSKRTQHWPIPSRMRPTITITVLAIIVIAFVGKSTIGGLHRCVQSIRVVRYPPSNGKTHANRKFHYNRPFARQIAPRRLLGKVPRTCRYILRGQSDSAEANHSWQHDCQSGVRLLTVTLPSALGGRLGHARAPQTVAATSSSTGVGGLYRWRGSRVARLVAWPLVHEPEPSQQALPELFLIRRMPRGVCVRPVLAHRAARSRMGLEHVMLAAQRGFELGQFSESLLDLLLPSGHVVAPEAALSLRLACC